MSTLRLGRLLALAPVAVVLLLLTLALPAAHGRRQIIARHTLQQQQQQLKLSMSSSFAIQSDATDTTLTASSTPATSVAATNDSTAALPIFFFHGVLSNAKSGYRLAANFTRDGRVFIPLTFCTNHCSVQALEHQVQLAIAQIRAITANDARFAHGYVFIGHSQGGAIARAVVEEMDDHNVKVLVSLAGAVNGVFYGPQPADVTAALVFLRYLGSQMVPTTVWDPTQYTLQDLRGPFQRDMDAFARDHPALQSQYSAFNLARSVVPDAAWLALNPYLPKLNNLVDCNALDTNVSTVLHCKHDQTRRRSNFLRLHAAHFFASPDDGVIAPWQSSILGQYSELATVESIARQFESLRVLDMRDTREYQQDLYGLQTLDRRGGLHLHVVAGVPHTCWVTDSAAFGSVHPCFFDEVYDEHVYAALR